MSKSGEGELKETLRDSESGLDDKCVESFFKKLEPRNIQDYKPRDGHRYLYQWDESIKKGKCIRSFIIHLFQI